MKKVVIFIIVIAMLFACTGVSFAQKESQVNPETSVTSDEAAYEEMVCFLEEVAEIFPEANVRETPSFEEFRDALKQTKPRFSGRIIASYEKVINDNTYYLYVYDNGSVEMITITPRALSDGESGLGTLTIHMECIGKCHILLSIILKHLSP